MPQRPARRVTEKTAENTVEILKISLIINCLWAIIIIGRNWIYQAELCEEIDKLYAADGCFRILSGRCAVRGEAAGAVCRSFIRLRENITKWRIAT